MDNEELNEGDFIDTMVWCSSALEKLITPAKVKATCFDSGYIIADFNFDGARIWNISPDPTTIFDKQSSWGKVIKPLNKPIKKSEKDLELFKRFWKNYYL